MTGKALALAILALPEDQQNLEIEKSNYDGCPECNPECLPILHSVSGVEHWPPYEGHYPHHDKKKGLLIL